MMIYVVSTCIPDRGEKPCQPNVFATLAEAESFADQMLRNEWDTAALEDDDGNALPYPGDWREANDAIAASYDDGSWGEWDLTSHEVPGPAHDALAQMRAYVEKVAGWTMLEDEYNAETPEGEMLRDQYDDIEEYRSDIDDDRLLSDFADLQGLIGEARELIAGLPHVTPDAVPAAPHTPEPGWRAIAGSLVGLAAGRAEEMESAVGEGGDAWSQEEADEAWSAVEAARAAFAGSPAPQTPDASALMLDALRLAAERIEMNNYGGEEDEHLAVIRAAIATGEA